jgi:hypothetical protein
MKGRVSKRGKQKRAGSEKIEVISARLDQLHEELEEMLRQLESLETRHQEWPVGSNRDASHPQTSEMALPGPDYWSGSSRSRRCDSSRWAL